MVESEGAFHLTFVQGRGLLSLSGREIEGLGRVDTLELEIPNLRFPFDLSGGVARFKNRRLRLRELAIQMGGREITGFLARAPLRDFGIFDPRVSIEGSRLTLCARILLGGREAEITTVAVISPLPPASARLCVCDVRVFGFLPVPAALVVTALFSALGAETPANRDSTPDLDLPPLVHIRSAADIRIDACDLAMLAILPTHGWRMPERKQVRIRVAGGAAKATRLPLVFSLADPALDADPLLGEDASPEAYPMREFTARCGPIEDALARGDIANALALLRALSPVETDDRMGTTRLLQLLLASENTLAEADELARAALARWPESVPATLALAVIAGEHGEAERSAELYQEVAKLSAALGRNEDESCALLAAARQWAAAGNQDAALASLEHALLLRPSLRPVARAKLMRQAVEGGWKTLLASLGEALAVGETDLGDEVAQILDLVHQGGVANDTVLVAQAAESLEGLLRREIWPEASLSRAEAAYQMGLVRLILGDEQAASQWFAACIEGDASATLAATAWHALVDLLRRRQEPAGVAQALVGWAGDARVMESPEQKLGHILEAARIAECDLSDWNRALTCLDAGLALAPADPGVLAALERLGRGAGHSEAVLALLRRHLRETRPDQGKEVLRVMLRLLVEDPDRQVAAREACQLLLQIAPNDDEASLIFARIAWDAGERSAAGPRYLGLCESSALAPPELAEACLRSAQVAGAEGRTEDAERLLARGLADEPKGARVDILAEALRELGREDRLRELLTAREALLPDERQRWQLRRSLAVGEERKGNLDEAEAMYRELLGKRPDDIELLDRLASICKRQRRIEDWREWLEKLWALIERAGKADGQAGGLEGSGGMDTLAVGFDLARLLAGDPATRARAEAILRKLIEHAPGDPRLLDTLDQLLVEQGDWEEAGKILGRRLAITLASELPVVLLTRARLRRAQPEGARAALAALQTQAVDTLDEACLRERMDLGDKVDDVEDAIACVRELRGRPGAEADPGLLKRLAELLARPSAERANALALLEKLQTELPDSLHVAKALFEVYGRLDDADARNLAWQALLAKVPALPDVYRARLQVALSEVAEREGDLQAAEKMLDKAGQLDHSPRARVDQLVVHARLLVARGDLDTAEAELEEALNLNPDSAGALALLGDLAYRAQEWERARTAYTRLAQIPEAPQVVSAETLAFRRAELAEMFGDHVEAEAAYREVVALDPANDGAREALAGFAMLRGDMAEAALHLKEVVRLLPKEAVERLTLARQRLGQVYLGLGDLQSARQNLELAMASEPDRASTLELIITAYIRLGLHRDAAAMCERLSRLNADPPKRAEALYRKGEILRTALGDPEGATDAYLRASDLDPSYAPTLARLVSYYWAHADLVHLADVGTDLVQAAPMPKVDQKDLGLLVAMAALLASHDETQARLALESPLLGAPLRPDLAAIRFGELVSKVERGSLPALDKVVDFVLQVAAPGFEDELRAAAARGVEADTGDAGQALLLGRLFERNGNLACARAAYSLAHFIDPGLGAGERLDRIGDEAKPRVEAYAPGASVHPLCRGPLRKVLRHLAPVLASGGGAPVYDEPLPPLASETLAICETLRAQMSAPPVPFLAQGHGVDVTLSASHPLSILIGRRAESLASTELRFFVARALEQARAGTLAVLRMSADNLRGLLRAVLRVAGAPGTPFELAEEAADEATALWLGRLRAPEVAALIPMERLKDELAADASAALTHPPEIEDYIRGCRFTADRVGLLLGGRPLTALRVLAGLLKDGAAEGEVATVAQRQSQVRVSPALREIVAFMLSDEYAALVDSD